jgi:nicotinamide riboside kinase
MLKTETIYKGLAQDKAMESFIRRNRVYFVGAHSAGKTTLAKWTAKEYCLPLIPETARVVLKDPMFEGKTLDEIRLVPELIDAFQYEIFNRQFKAEEPLACFVSDRGCDHLAYAQEHSQNAHLIVGDDRWPEYIDKMRRSTVFFVRPHRELMKPDGVRCGLDWDSVVRIDAQVKGILKRENVRYVPIDAMAMESRISTIMAVLGRTPSVMGGENN